MSTSSDFSFILKNSQRRKVSFFVTFIFRYIGTISEIVAKKRRILNEWNFFFAAAVFFRPCLGPFVSFPRCTQLLSNFCGREGLKGHVRLAVMPAALSPLTLGVPFFNILPVKNQTPIRLKRSSFFLLLNLLSKKMNEKSWFFGNVFEQSEEMSWDLCLLKSLAKQSSFSSDLLAKTKKSPKGLVQQKTVWI